MRSRAEAVQSAQRHCEEMGVSLQDLLVEDLGTCVRRGELMRRMRKEGYTVAEIVQCIFHCQQDEVLL